MTTPLIGPRGFPYWEKDPQAVKDYQVDWTVFLAGDTISSHVVTVPAGLTKDADSRNGAVITIWLSGGTVGKTYRVTTHVVTVGGRTDERSFEIIVKDQ